MLRTDTTSVDKTFTLDTEITKSGTLPNGRRFIRGVASGCLEDADGERVSKRAIAKMATGGGEGLKLTSSHVQDWATEIGDVVKIEHDSEHDELLVDTELPPEGEDPMADKAWRKMASGETMGFSIGGKLRKAYFELTDTGKRRKVLDDVDLRHVMLTKKPAYKQSFAQAVAKSLADVDLPEPSDEDFRDEDEFPDEPVEKVSNRSAADQDAGGGPTGDRNAGVKGKDTPAKEVNDEGDKPAPTDDLPKARHLSCPNCGHEFAAELDPESPPDDEIHDDERSAKKTASEETTMPTPIENTLEELKGLASDEPVEKTEPDTPDDVEKAEGEYDLPTVAKMLAASHRQGEEKIEALEARTADALGTVVKAVNDLSDAVKSLPQGRRSVARRAPGEKLPADRPDHSGDVEKTRVEEDADVEKRIAEADSPIEALKIQNEHLYGISAT